MALVKNNATPTVIVAMTHLVWHRIYKLNITAWFGWVPGTRNIADLPTRKVKIPFRVLEEGTFDNLRPLFGNIKSAVVALEAGRPIIAPDILQA